MLRIRKVADATTAPNRAAIEAAQKIMREQFSAMPDYGIAKLRRLSTLTASSRAVRGRECARPDARRGASALRAGYRLLLSRDHLDRPWPHGEGIGATLYERVREEARARHPALFREPAGRSGAEPRPSDQGQQREPPQILRALRRAADRQHRL